MIKLENYEVLGWEHAIRGMRNPMNSWEKSDSKHCSETLLCRECPAFEDDNKCHIRGSGIDPLAIGPNDHDLMMRLASAGPVHGKFRRMITVYVDITAPLYWWKEFDTYKVGTVANSCSTMHKIHAKEFELSDFSTDHLVGSSLDYMNYLMRELNGWRTRYLATKDKEDWWQMIQLLPSSYNQKRTVQLNYEVLANMYEYRKAHKLDEWVEFCKWIETLPYSEIITAGLPAVIEPEPVVSGKGKGPNGVVRPEEDIKKYGNAVRGE